MSHLLFNQNIRKSGYHKISVTFGEAEDMPKPEYYDDQFAAFFDKSFFDKSLHDKKFTYGMYDNETDLLVQTDSLSDFLTFALTELGFTPDGLSETELLEKVYELSPMVTKYFIEPSTGTITSEYFLDESQKTGKFCGIAICIQKDAEISRDGTFIRLADYGERMTNYLIDHVGTLNIGNDNSFYYKKIFCEREYSEALYVLSSMWDHTSKYPQNILFDFKDGKVVPLTKNPLL